MLVDVIVIFMVFSIVHGNLEEFLVIISGLGFAVGVVAADYDLT
jgi:hypothetical protein